MVISQKKSNRAATGARIKEHSKKRITSIGRTPTLTKLDEKKLKVIKVRGHGVKQRLLNANIANVYIPKEKKYVKLEIETIVKTPASRHFVRRNIITKGAIVKTDKGEARVTSRPGQDGIINAILV